MKRPGPVSLLLILFSATMWAQENPLPFLNQPLSPSSIAPGSSAFTLAVSGTGFASGAVLKWNGSPRTTTVISGSTLQASITAADIAHFGTASITVTNPPPGGGTSLPVYFYVRDSYISVALVKGPVLLSPGAEGLVVGDFNGDGKLDIAISEHATNDSPVGTIQLHLGNGDGTFQTPISSPTYTDATTQPTRNILAGDFNGDGKLDLAVTQYDELGFGSVSVQILFGNGDGTFTLGPATNGCGSDDSGALGAVGDLNRDGYLDYIFLNGNLGSDWPTVCLGTGDGIFNFGSTGLAQFSGNPAIGDFNRDGILDYFSADKTWGSVYLGNGNGTFQGPSLPAAGNAVIGDINHDGFLDVVLDSGEIWMGNGDGTFTAATPLLPPWGVGLALQDVQGNNQLDVATIGNASLIVYPAATNGSGSYGNPLSFPGGGGATGQLGVGDFNNDGRVDFVVPGNKATQVLLQTQLSIAPLSLNYGTLQLGSSQVLNLVLTNLGPTKLPIRAITIVGANAANYSIPLKQCVGFLESEKSCTLSVTFTPGTTGALNASLRIQYKDIGSPQSIPLIGTGTAKN